MLQEAVLVKMVSVFRPDISLYDSIGKRGNTYIKSKIKALNEASVHLPHIIITDLDDIECAPALIADWVSFKLSKKLLFRIAEKEVEAWIMADRKNFARFLGVPVVKIPINTEQIANPKTELVNMARRSKRKQIKDLISEGTAQTGPGYNLILQEFIFNQWDPVSAAEHNVSLSKAIERLKFF
ncbi:MAG: hypothetical protein K2X48_03465 [Chitinophagaceae bacterium]|nr:hypothetical protein [Chitinophagaceae bacterium]